MTETSAITSNRVGGHVGHGFDASMNFLGQVSAHVVNSGKFIIDIGRQWAQAFFDACRMKPKEGTTIKYLVGVKASEFDMEYQKDFYTNVGKELVDLSKMDELSDDLLIIDTSKFKHTFNELGDQKDVESPDIGVQGEQND
ncbi:MAG: hypothetical protein ISR65_03150 [Bacteriovoracaceae bacterium]|nr:hypothetical protein [Bacteriovoracaceae bacterium]